MARTLTLANRAASSGEPIADSVAQPGHHAVKGWLHWVANITSCVSTSISVVFLVRLRLILRDSPK
jgi:hypothetical protein